MEFEPWPSISRLNKDAVYTEKINGTNAAIVIERIHSINYMPGNGAWPAYVDGVMYAIGAQSRKRMITPEDDNFGFARWVRENRKELVSVLGEGRHFGEWWGSGIQGGYGLPKGEKRFSLFNVKRWEDVLDWNKGHDMLPELYMVPVLDRSMFSTERAKELVHELRYTGSWASPGFMKPEGVVVFHTASGTLFKTFLENDLIHKSQQKG